MHQRMRWLLVCASVACGHDDGANANVHPDAFVAIETRDAAIIDATPDVAPRAAPVSLIERSHVVLQVGDSMVGFLGGLQKALDKRFTAHHIHFYSRSWTSAGITSVDDDGELDKALARFAPDLVLLNLGMNNVTYPHPEALMGHVASIVKKLSKGGRACVWIGPPSWKPDLGLLVPFLKKNVAPCVFFDSQDLELERQTDDVHPTDLGGEIWGEAVWRSLENGGTAPSEIFLP